MGEMESVEELFAQKVGFVWEEGLRHHPNYCLEQVARALDRTDHRPECHSHWATKAGEQDVAFNEVAQAERCYHLSCWCSDLPVQLPLPCGC